MHIHPFARSYKNKGKVISLTPVSRRADKDLKIIFHVDDGTDLSMIVPINSLRTISNYCEVKLDMNKFQIEVCDYQKIVDSFIEFYDQIGIRITGTKTEWV